MTRKKNMKNQGFFFQTRTRTKGHKSDQDQEKVPGPWSPPWSLVIMHKPGVCMFVCKKNICLPVYTFTVYAIEILNICKLYYMVLMY